MTSAPFGLGMDWATSAILPSRIKMDPCSIVPCETVSIVAFWIRRTGGAASGGAAERVRDTTTKFSATMAKAIRHAYFAHRSFIAHLPLRHAGCEPRASYR